MKKVWKSITLGLLVVGLSLSLIGGVVTLYSQDPPEMMTIMLSK